MRCGWRLVHRVGSQNSATSPDLSLYVARSHSLMRPAGCQNWCRASELDGAVPIVARPWDEAL